MNEEQRPHVVRVYYPPDNFYGEYEVTNFKIQEGMLILYRNDVYQVVFAPGGWLRLVDLTEVDGVQSKAKG